MVGMKLIMLFASAACTRHAIVNLKPVPTPLAFLMSHKPRSKRLVVEAEYLYRCKVRKLQRRKHRRAILQHSCSLLGRAPEELVEAGPPRHKGKVSEEVPREEGASQQTAGSIRG